MRTLLIHISDIHYDINGKLENQDKVLNAFLTDVSEQVSKIPHSDLYVLISGDIVQAADDKANYTRFEQNVVKPLVKALSLERNHILAVPGNHDLQRNYVIQNYEVHHSHFEAKYDEEKFNDLIRDGEHSSELLEKFKNFQNFVESSFNRQICSKTAYGVDLNETWSILCINTAILSEGGYNNVDDNGHLAIDTRAIIDWTNQHKTTKNILMMHHPKEQLMDEYKSHISEVVKNNFSLVLTGHVHDQDIYSPYKNGEQIICLSSPQLFSDKGDSTLGYSLIIIDEMGPEMLVYRAWYEHNGRFAIGVPFVADEENPGRVLFRQGENTLMLEDKIISIYEGKLAKEMHVFANQPEFWIDRFLSEERIDNGHKSFKDLTLISENDVISKNESLYIYSPEDGGLTCYALHFLLTLRKVFNKIGLYVKCHANNLNVFQKDIELAMQEIGVEDKKIISWVVLDDVYTKISLAKEALISMKNQFPNAMFMVLTTQKERIKSDDSEDDKEFLDSINVRFLTPIMRSQMRQLVDCYNKRKFIGESDKVLKRLDDDLQNFNMHRSPLGCITLLEVQYDNQRFEEYPINRTLVLEKALRKIFDAAEMPTYHNALPNMNECEYATGYFCSQLIRGQENESQLNGIEADFLFTKEQYIKAVRPIFDDFGNSVDANVLFEMLLVCGVIVPYGGYFTFRFRTWAYYFAAIWMLKNDDFAKYMLSSKRYLHYPDILEFYTGKTQQQKDALEVLSTDLSKVVKSVKEKFNASDDFNPFARLKLKDDPEVQKKVTESIQKQIKESSLPNELKDQMLDATYNAGAPFNQNIYQNVLEYTVKHMFADIEIASKSLRNSDLVSKVTKQTLLSNILDAWSVFAKIITFVSKEFAQQGSIYIEGIGFTLVDSYNDYDESEKVLEIIASIPNNIMRLFKDDIYSAKLGDLIIDSFNTETDKIRKHLLACLIISMTPTGWDKSIEQYIRTQEPNSFYIGDVLRAISARKSWGIEGDSNIPRLNSMLRLVSYKINVGKMPSSIKEADVTRTNMADVPLMKFMQKKRHRRKK